MVDKRSQKKSTSWTRRIVLLGIVIIVLGGIGAVYKLSSINAFIWLSDYEFNSPFFEEPDQVVDIIFFVPDHWEPSGNQEILDTWMTDYRALADKHLDSDGNPLQWSWYYPLDQFHSAEVESLAVLCAEGYGEVGVQLHHRDDTHESVYRKLADGLDSLQKYGVLNSPDGIDRFSFVHGNWALDNSRLENDRNYCGVNDEISILLELGCYCDVTFPSLNQLSQPPWVNKFAYATDDPEVPKSFEDVEFTRVGFTPREDQLLLMQGPLLIDWEDWRFTTHPTLEDGCLYYEIPTSLHRFEKWLQANIHVPGRPEWIFVRPFAHGAGLAKGNGAGYDNILGINMDKMLTEVEARYNDGENYRLHYMTTREAYNVVKAAEAGLEGNPNTYRDYLIKPMVYNSPTKSEEGL